MKKRDVDLTSEDNNKDSVCDKPGISRSQQLEESLKSKVVNNFFAKLKDRTVPIGDFLRLNTGGREDQNFRKSVLCRKVYIGS